MNCYLSRNYRGLDSAGNKAKTDIESTMRSLGFKNVGLPQTSFNNKILHFLFTLVGVLTAPFFIKKGDNLVLQYPLKKYFTFVCRMAHLRGANIIVVIHDLGSFRRKALTPEKEIRRLNHADYIIAHNEKMKGWLEAHHCKAKVGTLGLFDYLSSSNTLASYTHKPPYIIVYAGSLNPRKNLFLYEWGRYVNLFRVRLYGKGFNKERAAGSEKFDVMGFVSSEELISTVRGDFGLVWDGTSIDGCAGDFGIYLKVNNPHKTSLYLRCGLPVIIWKEAALADYVKRNGVGLCIGTLKELDETLANLTREEYDQMKQRAERVSKLVGSSYYFRTAVERAIKEMEDK